MKRDFDLIRLILIEVEDRPAESSRSPVRGPDGYDPALIREHARLMIDAGLLDGKVIPGSPETPPIVSGLTWDGHDFIAAARHDSLWRKALSFISEKGSAITLPILAEVLKEAARSAAGLP